MTCATCSVMQALQTACKVQAEMAPCEHALDYHADHEHQSIRSCRPNSRNCGSTAGRHKLLKQACLLAEERTCLPMQVAETLHAAGSRELQVKLKELVKHIRENKLRMTFTDALGQAQSEGDGVSSQKEAKRLAFYLFWNVRTDYDRLPCLRRLICLVFGWGVNLNCQPCNDLHGRANIACCHDL